MDHNFKKKFGQNFLKDNNIIDKIVSSNNFSFNDLVIEVGPGAGALTKELLKKTNVLAYEVDLELKDKLNNIERSGNLDIIWDDFLNRDIKEDLKKYNYNNIYFVSNLPYYITTPIITKLIESKINFQSITVMVQKEVAERFSSEPGKKDYGSITVYLNYFYNIEKVVDVPRTCFVPAPNVDSSVIKFIPKKEKVFIKDETLFFKLIRDSFQFKRKNLRNNLKSYDLTKIEEILHKHNLDLTVRAENISVDLFAEIANNL